MTKRNREFPVFCKSGAGRARLYGLLIARLFRLLRRARAAAKLSIIPFYCAGEKSRSGTEQRRTRSSDRCEAAVEKMRLRGKVIGACGCVLAEKMGEEGRRGKNWTPGVLLV